ncbi:HTH_48 domain-containing protein [Trichonephila clavipes]|nr:HTH_48 domain-containing protein [Trichonephila clavipes]
MSPVQVARQHQETAENEQRVRHLLNTDRRLTVRMIAEQPGMDKMVAHKIISEGVGIRKICAKLVPKVLTDVQKQNREAVSKDLLERIQEDPHFFDNIITGDESWFFQYDPQTKIRATDGTLPHSPRQKKARLSENESNVSLTRMVLSIRNLCPKDKQSMVPSTWNPNLSPADFFLFPKVKTALKGRHHGTLDDVKRACTHALKDVSVGKFQRAYEAWKRRLQKLYIEVVKLLKEIIRVQMMWFVREEFLCSSFSAKVFQSSPVFSLSALSSFGNQRPVSLASSYIRLGGRKRVPHGVKGCRGDPRRDHAMILKLQCLCGAKSSREVSRRVAECEGPEHLQGVLPQNWGGTEPNRTVT